MDMINATGRRKASVARVYLKKGEGKIEINGRELKEYFPQIHIQTAVTAPLETVEVASLYDIKVNVMGGGFKGQAEAVRMGISRALVQSPGMRAKSNAKSTANPRRARASSSASANAQRLFFLIFLTWKK
jgi:ribosomal protein S9